MKAIFTGFFIFLPIQTVLAQNLNWKSLFDKEKVLYKAESSKDKVSQAPGPNSSYIGWQSAFLLRDDPSLQNSESDSVNRWFWEIPYVELEAVYEFYKNSFVKIEGEFIYQKGKWKTKVEDVYVRYKNSSLVPVSLKIGYFSYPTSYASKNSFSFSNKLLVQKNLFARGRRRVGISLSYPFKKFFSLDLGVHSPLIKINPENQIEWGRFPVLTARLQYKKPSKNIFVSYHQKDIETENQMRSMGLGADVSYKIQEWNFKLRGELWNIQKEKNEESLLVYYAYPQAYWKKLFLGALYGNSCQSQPNSPCFSEYILQAGYYFNEKLFFIAERLWEKQNSVKINSWSFALKSQFRI